MLKYFQITDPFLYFHVFQRSKNDSCLIDAWIILIKILYLMKKQFGFRTNHSTYMAIIELVYKVVSAIERNESTLGIFLDLSKRLTPLIMIYYYTN